MDEVRSRSAIEARILELFEIHRALPGAPWEEGHFLDDLILDPRRRGSVHDSFTGRRRFVRFVRDVELELGVCFARSDLERTWTPRSLAERVQAKARDPRANLRLVEDRIRRERASYPVPWICLNVVALVLAVTAARTSATWTGAGVGVVIIVSLNAGMAAFRARELRASRCLAEAIRESRSPR